MKRVPPLLLVAGALLLGAIGYFVFTKIQAASEAAKAEAQLLADVDSALAREPVDGSELSSLVTRIQRLPEHERDRRFALALARIDRARGRLQPAWDRLRPFASAGDANGAELREGAILSLRLHAHSGDRDAGRRAQAMAEQAYAATQEPALLLVAWQAAQRIHAEADRARIADLLVAQHGNTREARMVEALRQLDRRSERELAGLAGEFDEEPVELGLGRAALLLQGGQVGDAVDLLEKLCLRAPALVDLRHFAAVASLELARQEGIRAELRDSHLARGRAHLEWLLRSAPADDPRRGDWQRLLGR